MDDQTTIDIKYKRKILTLNGKTYIVKPIWIT